MVFIRKSVMRIFVAIPHLSRCEHAGVPASVRVFVTFAQWTYVAGKYHSAKIHQSNIVSIAFLFPDHDIHFQGHIFGILLDLQISCKCVTHMACKLCNCYWIGTFKCSLDLHNYIWPIVTVKVKVVQISAENILSLVMWYFCHLYDNKIGVIMLVHAGWICWVFQKWVNVEYPSNGLMLSIAVRG